MSEALALLVDISDKTAPQGFTSSSYTTALDSLQTALSVAGRGALNYIYLYNPSGNTINSGEVQVSIDGSSYGIAVANFDASNLLLPLPGWPFTGMYEASSFAAAGDHISPLFELNFKTSLQIKIKSDGTNNLRVTWGISI